MSNEGIQKQLFYVSTAYNICVLYLFIILWDTIQDKIKHLILSQYLDNVSISIIRKTFTRIILAPMIIFEVNPL